MCDYHAVPVWRDILIITHRNAHAYRFADSPQISNLLALGSDNARRTVVSDKTGLIIIDRSFIFSASNDLSLNEVVVIARDGLRVGNY